MNTFEVNVGYKNEGYSTILFYKSPLLEVYKGITQKNKELFIGVSFPERIFAIYSTGEFAINILKLAKEKKASQIKKICYQQLCSNVKNIEKLTKNIYDKGFHDGKNHIRGEFNKVLNGY